MNPLYFVVDDLLPEKETWFSKIKKKKGDKDKESQIVGLDT